MHDVAEFLKAHAPFGYLSEGELMRLARRTEVEYFAAGTTIFKQDGALPREVRVIRKGVVELVEGGRVLDQLEPGEMFGRIPAFAGLPGGWEARAREDTLCYVVAADDVAGALGDVAGVRHGGAHHVPGIDPSQQPAVTVATERPLIGQPEESLREAASRMVEAGASSLLVRLDGGRLGILTDRDMRTRVVARGVSLETPVRDVVTTPVFTVRADATVADLMLAMLERDIHHVPVLSDGDEVVGMVIHVDLLAAQAQAPFVLRRAIAAAGSADELHEAAERLTRMVVELHRGGLAAGEISAIISVVVETLVRRMVELAIEAAGPAPAGFAWLSLGSHGRREAAPSSDIDSALVWDAGADASTTAYMRGIAERVDELLVAAGFHSDAHGVTATRSGMSRAAGAWRQAIQRWIDEPTDDAVMAISILLDGRSIHGPPDAFGVFSAVGDARTRRALLRLLLRLAVSIRPPTGFLRDIVVEHSGEHRGSFDIKLGGLLPIVGIARYAGLAAGSTSTSTPSRLHAAGAAGVLRESEASTLQQAYRFMTALRMEHQVRELEAGTEPDDFIDPKALDRLTRRQLRDAFRVVASTQNALGAGLRWEP